MLLAAVVLVVLTQTQVGRDGVARQIERQFDAEYEGSLTIGRLSGNLVWDLYARDVVVRDPEGNVVIAVDSVVMHPHWRSLVSREFEVRAMHLHGARVQLVKGEAGWNLQRTFTSRIPGESDGGMLDLNVADVRISGGSILTRNEGGLPASVTSGVMFDYTNASATNVAGLVRLRSGRSGHTLRVRNVSADLPDPGVSVRRLDGRIRITDDDVVGDGLRLLLGESRATGSFTVTENGIALDLGSSRIAADDLRRFVPAADLPAHSLVQLTARGPLDAIDVREMKVSGGASSFSARGSVHGLPDSLGFDLSFTDMTVRTEDLRNNYPNLLPRGADPGTVSGRGTASGSLDWTNGFFVRARSNVDLSSAAGVIAGRIAVTMGNGDPHYEVDVMTRDLDLARITGDQTLSSSITGHIEGAGRGEFPSEFDGTLLANLDRSSFAGRRSERFHSELTARGGVLSGNAVFDIGGLVAIEGIVDLRTSRADLTVQTERLDLKSLIPGAPETSLTGMATVATSGDNLDDLIGDLTLKLSGSTLAMSDSTWHLPDESIAISMRPSNPGGTRLRLETEALVVNAAGDFHWADLASAVEYWAGRFGDEVRRDLLPRLNSEPEASESRERVRPVMAPQNIVLTVRSLKPGALFPWADGFDEGSAISITGRVSGDDLSAQVIGTVDRLNVGGISLSGLNGLAAVDAAGSGALLDQLQMSIEARTSIHFAKNGSPATARLDALYDPRDRSLTLESRFDKPADNFAGALDARVAVLQDRYRLVGDFLLDAPGQEWRVQEGEIDLFADALRFVSFNARRNGSEAYGQRSELRLAGVASARTEDYLHVHGTDISLGSIMALIDDKLPFDGLVSADFEVSSLLGQPAIVGRAEAEEFSVWGEPAGRVEATSEILAGREGFDVNLRLLPLEDGSLIQNDGRLFGSLRFPGRRIEGRRDPGFFDLRFEVERLDMFIFDHLFPDIVAGARGGGTGSGSITGDWDYPVFTAAFSVDDGRASVPEFNLGIAIAGEVDIDRQGIHLRDVALADKAGGHGLVNGSILFNEYRYFSFDLAASLHEFEVIDVGQSHAGALPFYGQIRASGSATLTGPMDNVFLHSPNVVTTPDSRLFIPVTASGPTADAGFLVFTDTEGRIPEVEARRHLVAERPKSERPFLEGLEMLLNIQAPHGSTVHLVFDPAIGDVINAVGSATLQLAITEGLFQMFGAFDVDRGDYLFTAGQVFTRRFDLDPGGTLVWEGDPVDARLNLPAAYRTRASLAGLGLAGVDERQRVPTVVGLQVGGRVSAPLVDLSIDLDESGGRSLGVAEPLRRRLNEPDRQAEYATSVLLTNTFLLAPTDPEAPLTRAADDLFYTSLSELVSARLNLFLNHALAADYLDVAVGVQQGSNLQDLDLTYGLAVRLLDERLIIRGEGVYHQLENRPGTDALQGEVVVELRMSDSVSLEVFYRRENDLLAASGVAGALTEAYGAGVNYQAEFAGWRRLFERIFAVAEAN